MPLDWENVSKLHAVAGLDRGDADVRPVVRPEGGRRPARPAGPHPRPVPGPARPGRHRLRPVLHRPPRGPGRRCTCSAPAWCGSPSCGCCWPCASDRRTGWTCRVRPSRRRRSPHAARPWTGLRTGRVSRTSVRGRRSPAPGTAGSARPPVRRPPRPAARTGAGRCPRPPRRARPASGSRSRASRLVIRRPSRRVAVARAKVSSPRSTQTSCVPEVGPVGRQTPVVSLLVADDEGGPARCRSTGGSRASGAVAVQDQAEGVQLAPGDRGDRPPEQLTVRPR